MNEHGICVLVILMDLITVVRTLRGHKTSIQCLNFHGNGDIVVTGSADTNIKIWDLRRKGCVYTCKVSNCIKGKTFMYILFRLTLML